MTNRINRRDFIRISTAAGAIGLTLPDLINAHPSRAGSPQRKSLASYDGQANELLSRMTLEEKIGQMTQAEQDALKDIDDIETYSLGSLLSGGNSDPKAGNSLEAWTDLYDRLQTRAMKTRLAIPLLYG